jgi:hypothetical protein
MRKLFVFALAAAALCAFGISLGSAQARAATTTQQIVVRPVDTTGHAVAGYSVTTETISGFSCNEGASPVAVNANIRFCGFSATYTVACWKSTNHTALCLRDPRVKKLVRIHYTGSFNPVAPPKHPSPQALGLRDTSYCTIRDGGAWSRPVNHPSWVGFYSCNHNQDVYGPPSTGDGITRTSPLWSVHTIAPSGKGPATLRYVTKAYFAGVKFHP